MSSSRHVCDERCACPVHGTPLIYWPAGDDHACQDVTCRYGHGGLDDGHESDGFMWNDRGWFEQKTASGSR